MSVKVQTRFRNPLAPPDSNGEWWVWNDFLNRFEREEDSFTAWIRKTLEENNDNTSGISTSSGD